MTQAERWQSGWQRIYDAIYAGSGSSAPKERNERSGSRSRKTKENKKGKK